MLRNNLYESFQLSDSQEPVLTSYITRPHLFAGRVFAYIGVQMALPLLIISSIKKVANKISRLVDNKLVGALGKTSTPDLKFQPREIKVKSVVIFTTS